MIKCFNYNALILAYKKFNRIDNLVAKAMTTEVIVSKIHKAYRLRETDFVHRYYFDHSGPPQRVVVLVLFKSKTMILIKI